MKNSLLHLEHIFTLPKNNIVKYVVLMCQILIWVTLYLSTAIKVTLLLRSTKNKRNQSSTICIYHRNQIKKEVFSSNQHYKVFEQRQRYANEVVSQTLAKQAFLLGLYILKASFHWLLSMISSAKVWNANR